ncbi:MAG TPA: energy transducer TonB [Caulobacteraceae bacterium]|jgi:outer membrane biosynthesis protein TonB
MTAMGVRRRENRGPALAAAAVLHVGLFLAVLWFSKPALMPMGTSVPINIVATGPTTNSRPAQQAPIAQDALTPTPVPEAKAPTPPPAPPQPVVKQVQPAPPKPAPKPALKPVPQPAKAAPTPARDTFSLDALQASVAKSAKSAPARPANARRGPARAETAPEARVEAGTGVSQSDIAGLQQLLQRLWNPDCTTDEKVMIPVRFTVSFDGHIQGRVDARGKEASADPVVQAAARRAIDAVHQAAPYADTYRGIPFTINFDAKKACAAR